MMRSHTWRKCLRFGRRSWRTTCTQATFRPNGHYSSVACEQLECSITMRTLPVVWQKTTWRDVSSDLLSMEPGTEPMGISGVVKYWLLGTTALTEWPISSMCRCRAETQLFANHGAWP